MSTERFVVRDHTVPCQYIREYRNATFEGVDFRLQLSVKQYIPRKKDDSSGITILAAGGNGFPKEMYEPLWDDILSQITNDECSIKAIIIADMAHQGQSGVMNRGKLGHDPSWFDHARDLLQVVNYFGREMTSPIVGIGHSIGGTSLINLGFFHPRLFSHLILFEPIVGNCSREGMQLAYHAIRKPESWPSRFEAERQLSSSPPFNKFDPRVFQSWLQNGLANTNIDNQRVVLTTSKYQEAVTYVRPLFQHANPGSSEPETALYPGFSEQVDHGCSFYCPAADITLNKLPDLRPRTLFLFGAKSGLSPEPRREQLLQQTGTGLGGSGGAAHGRVKSKVVQQCGHLLPFEDPEQCAGIIGQYFSQVTKSDEDMDIEPMFDGMTNQMCTTWNKRLCLEMEAMKKKTATGASKL